MEGTNFVVCEGVGDTVVVGEVVVVLGEVLVDKGAFVVDFGAVVIGGDVVVDFSLVPEFVGLVIVVFREEVVVVVLVAVFDEVFEGVGDVVEGVGEIVVDEGTGDVLFEDAVDVVD